MARRKGFEPLTPRFEDSIRSILLFCQANHRDLVLADHERKDTIMICVSRVRGDEITIDR